VKKSQASIEEAWLLRNWPQVEPIRLGDGSTPWRRKIAQTLDGASSMPMVASSPWIRRYPQVGFSLARRRTILWVPKMSSTRLARAFQVFCHTAGDIYEQQIEVVSNTRKHCR